MKKQLSFFEEGAPISQLAGNAIGQLARHGTLRNGAAVGGIAGGVGGAITNSLKRDDDPTKKSTMGAIVGGAAKGAAVGAVASRVGGSLARSKMGQGVQNKLFNDAAIKYGQDNIRRGIANGEIVVPKTGPNSAQWRDFANKVNQYGQQGYDSAMNSVKDAASGNGFFTHNRSLGSGFKAWKGKTMEKLPDQQLSFFDGVMLP